MANPNILDPSARKKIIDQIIGAENISRKRYEQRKFDIYRNRQADYVIERLNLEFSPETVKRMRKVLSINICKRIVDQLGSIYIREPERSWSNTANEDFEKELDDSYHHCGVDPQLRLANRYYKLCDQAALYIVPKGGKIRWRALTPKDYDVIPDDDDPEKAFAYVLNVFDVNMYGPVHQNVKEESNRYYMNSKTPQDISNDADRRKAMRFVWWTEDTHLTTDGNGELADGSEPIANPIGRLPFVDIANEKDYQFFVRRGNSVVEFAIDLLVQLCDLAEIVRLQGYSQAVIYSMEPPKDLIVGPNKVMWIKQPEHGEQSQPKFAFESPSPDLANSLEILNTQLKMFLSSMGLDASTVSGDTAKARFTSGIDHLLANIDKFQASQEDIDLFRRVETEAFEIHKKWSNEYQQVTGDDALDDELKIGQIDDSIELEVKYCEPQLIETKKDKEDSTIKRWDNNLLTTKDAVKELYGFDDDKAEEYIEELIADKATFARPALPGLGNPGQEVPGQQGGQPKLGPDGKPIQPMPNANGANPDSAQEGKEPTGPSAVGDDDEGDTE